MSNKDPQRHQIERSSTTEGLPVSPSLGPALAQAKVPTHATPIDGRTVYVCVLCAFVGLAAGLGAKLLLLLIRFFTNLSFYGRASVAPVVARDHHLGPWVILVPVVGAVIIGLIARYGSRAVAGHGIPEAMEQVLTNQSRIPPRMTFLKPLSAAISIGTGGPFGAEGPIIATGGALGSLVGQLLSTTASERKVLLSAGAAAGIAAAFGSPLAAVLLAIELLLFEFRPRSIIPVALASAIAAAIHVYFEGSEPMFPFTGAAAPVSASGAGLVVYTILGVVIGVGAVVLTRAVYFTEHFFEHLPRVHWMWKPAIGAVAVGLIGWWRPETFGPGYFNLDWLLSDRVVLGTAALLCLLKWLSWTISLGSGTAGGTLAPVFTIGGTLAATLVLLANRVFPHLPIDVRVAGLVGMVAIFAGASRALLTSVVFALEVTHAPAAVLPALCGCAAAYLTSALLMPESIMTEKMARQGVRVPAEYSADLLGQVLVSEVAARTPVTLRDTQRVGEVRAWIEGGGKGTSHQGYPIVDGNGHVVGVLTRRDLLDRKHDAATAISELIYRPPVVVYADCTLRDAADHMVNHDIGRLPVIARGQGGKLVGIITRSDLLTPHRRRLREAEEAGPTVRLFKRRQPAAARVFADGDPDVKTAALDARSR